MTFIKADISLPLERTRARILRVNYAGERGAIAIYSAQLSFKRLLPTETVAFLEHAIGHEREHAAKFRKAMNERNVSVCPGTFIWIGGGFLLGMFSVAGGNRGVMACTVAIEDAVHGHLNEQIAFLEPRDEALASLIRDIRIEEIEHKKMGQAGYNPECVTASAYTGVIKGITNALIWMATFGDSTRLKQLKR
ncbi:MAG: hypothetical protein DHS20C06_15110 [Hyphobacterium sp.]|nr:MAG: hypothetical protein DHS20C06_15110 [Hyphobacterium sp.]